MTKRNLSQRSQAVLEALNVEDFRPLRDIRNPHFQTIAGLYLPDRYRDLSGIFHRIDLPDRDALICVENKPRGWQDGDPIAILTHGLTGCSGSRYMSRLCGRLLERGVAVYRVNQRGCGPGAPHAVSPPHSGRSSDLRAVLQWLARRYPKSPAYLLGFSLGANMALVMVGEDGDQPTGNLKASAAVSPPIDLMATADKLSHRRNWHYNYYFSRRIRGLVREVIDSNPTLDREYLPKRLRLREIDEVYTAPLSGFRDASDYYARCSAAPLLNRVRIPTLILAAIDDPVVDTSAYAQVPDSSYLDTVLTKHGGHLGFLGSPTKGDRDVRWMDRVVLNWLDRLLR